VRASLVAALTEQLRAVDAVATAGETPDEGAGDG